jgi:MFS family permease
MVRRGSTVRVRQRAYTIDLQIRLVPLMPHLVQSAKAHRGLGVVDRPWQGFVCSAVGGAGFGFVGTAGQVPTLTLVPAEQRAASTALRRVAGNFGLGLGATVAGFIVATPLT